MSTLGEPPVAPQPDGSNLAAAARVPVAKLEFPEGLTDGNDGTVYFAGDAFGARE